MTNNDDSSPEPRIHQFFKAVVKMAASDLHIKTGSPPYVRVGGDLHKVNSASLTAQDVDQLVAEMLSPGTFGHGGAWGTQAWMDPVRGVAYVLMIQRNNFGNSDATDIRRAFQQAAVDALGRMGRCQ